MFRILKVTLNQRVAHICNGKFIELLKPGRYFRFTLLGIHDFIFFDGNTTPTFVGNIDPLPSTCEGLETFKVNENEMVAFVCNGEVTRVFSAGRFRFVIPDCTYEVRRFDLLKEPSSLEDEDILFASKQETWIEECSSDSQPLVLLHNDSPQKVLPPGRYRLWRDSPFTVRKVKKSLYRLEVAAQDLITNDQIQIRVKPLVSVRVNDPVQYVTEQDAEEQAYSAVQLALREVISSRPLEQLLQERKVVSEELADKAASILPAVGLSLEQVAVKDMVLSGEVKGLLGKVVSARMEAEAMSVRRREEVAQTRQMANTARLLQNNPVLMRLKEMETLTELASKIDKLTMVGGSELLQRVLMSDISTVDKASGKSRADSESQKE